MRAARVGGMKQAALLVAICACASAPPRASGPVAPAAAQVLFEAMLVESTVPYELAELERSSSAEIGGLRGVTVVSRPRLIALPGVEATISLGSVGSPDLEVSLLSELRGGDVRVTLAVTGEMTASATRVVRSAQRFAVPAKARAGRTAFVIVTPHVVHDAAELASIGRSSS
jgi:hypothetical protein